MSKYLNREFMGFMGYTRTNHTRTDMAHTRKGSE